MRLVVHRVTLIELFGELLNCFLSDHATRVPLDFIESSNFFLHPPSTCYFLFYYSHAKDCEMCSYISSKTDYAEHLSKRFLTICTAALKKHLFKFTANM